MEVNVTFKINAGYRANLKLLAKSYLGFKIYHRLEEVKSRNTVNTVIIPLASETP